MRSEESVEAGRSTLSNNAAQAVNRDQAASRNAGTAVQGLPSSAASRTTLAHTLQALGVELAGRHRAAPRKVTAFSVLVEGTTQDLDPILQDEVYRIADEALRNAFQHARARRIEVEVLYAARQLRVRVRDDGTGIDASVVSRQGRPGHRGLKGMGERARSIGGQLEVWSARGAGTEVELTVPGCRAHVAHAGWPFRLFRRNLGTES